MDLRHFYFSSIILLTLSCQTPNKTLELSDTFSAFVVKDIETSINWYSTNFGFEVVNETELENRGIKMANLTLGNTKVELIESNTAIDPFEDQKGIALGIFKVGYIVTSFDQWKDHLISKNAITERQVVTDPITNKRMLIVLDPDGNRIQLFEK